MIKASGIKAFYGGSSKTKTYLADLKQVAKLSGKNYAEVLQEMMAQISESIAELHPADTAKTEEASEEQTITDPHKMAATSSPLLNPAPAPTVRPKERTSSINIGASDLNPPEVQRYVVEHIVKSEDTAMHARSHHRLRVFSGKVPRPQHEVDYDTWRSAADLIMKDPAISEIQRSRLILDSLLPPASDIVKHLSHDLSADVYIKQLDSAYGTVQDGEELYAKFMDTLQDAGEKPSTYLQRLQVALSLAVSRGGVPGGDVKKHLLNQFCRGCWDNTLISELQLKQKKSSPPPFPELLLLLRTEEDREAAKVQRMKQHLGSTKQKVSSQAQFAYEEEEKGMCAALTTLTKQLTQQMAAIQQQLSALTAIQSQGQQSCAPRSSPATQPRVKPKSSASSTVSPKPGFCFRCGEDGHIKPQCVNPPNSALVSKKRKQFNEKKQRWQKQTSSSEQLN
ncbi:hypothetical protein WMY93_017783 [Mugilogobius chulae]|uniref:CCHC-type domain-containing protein n=1 Tax=Mugilogobius chulae TaxID=88201 RepID=A0AAW0NPQ2_9GOBI